MANLTFLAHKLTRVTFFGISVMVIMVVALSAVGAFIFIEYRPQESYSLSNLVHQNDTILLKSGVDSFWISDLNASQCVQPGDSSHDANIHVVRSDSIVKRKESHFFQSPVYYQDSPSYKSGIQDYLYLLEGSNFTYRICLASTTSLNQNATYFLFNDIVNYWNYVNDNDNGARYSVFSKALTATANNRTMCTSVSYNVNNTLYFFMMVLSPANIYYSYNFTLNKWSYDISNSTRYCKVLDSTTCHIGLQSRDFKHDSYDILAHVEPDSSALSLITHLCLTIFKGSPTLRKISYISMALLGLAGVIFATTVLMFGVYTLRMCIKHKLIKFSEEKQRLLNKY